MCVSIAESSEHWRHYVHFSTTGAATASSEIPLYLPDTFLISGEDVHSNRAFPSSSYVCWTRSDIRGKVLRSSSFPVVLILTSAGQRTFLCLSGKRSTLFTLVYKAARRIRVKAKAGLVSNAARRSGSCKGKSRTGTALDTQPSPAVSVHSVGKQQGKG